MPGVAILTYLHGSRYQGSVNDKYQPHGFGLLYDKLTHSSYEGQFQNGLKHGHGILTHHETNEEVEGQFVEGELYGYTLHYRLDAIKDSAIILSLDDMDIGSD